MKISKFKGRYPESGGLGWRCVCKHFARTLFDDHSWYRKAFPKGSKWEEK